MLEDKGEQMPVKCIWDTEPGSPLGEADHGWVVGPLPSLDGPRITTWGPVHPSPGVLTDELIVMQPVKLPCKQFSPNPLPGRR